MAEFLHLKPGASPPSDANWVLIRRTPSGAFDIETCVGEPKSLVISYDTGVSPQTFAMQRAAAEADRLGIPFVHIQGGELA
ncbi:hypothetical protein [Phenylobacterium sp.]|jgi:hypothetical protein|uniref:hypothetical protein n=1 Tax=Phenylobacterium sp. TaxID=1871053 RepID=UPI002E2F28B2|nr:hypothetical protein [Phenylobacterium sp.]HEX3365581.1 hypothetical protein [Phenylobacterium sp.]